MITIRIRNRSIPARQYLDGLRTAKQNPNQTYAGSLHGWWAATGAEITAQYRTDLHTRITERGTGRAPKGRVHPATWGKASTPRVVLERHDIRSLNRHARAKLQHRLREAD